MKPYKRKLLFAKRLILLPVCLLLNPVMAQERIEMEGTSITGNRESPKVLYIVPWQAPSTVSVRTPPIYSIIDESLQPVERKSFKRQIEYYNQAYKKSSDPKQSETN